MDKGRKLYNKAKKIIPGGTQLLSKRPEMFLPGFWPAYYDRAKGCEIWDLDGNKYLDMSTMGIGSCVLGYADRDVDAAVRKVIANGSMCTLNAPEEVKLAEMLIGLHPWAQMVRYARTGGEAMAVAVRLARAKAGRDIVLFCGYHGWHDWYLSANLFYDKSLDGHLLPGLNPLGVPRLLKGTALPFKYNDLKGFLKLVEKNKERVGVVVLETIRDHEPEKEFLDVIRRVTKKQGVVLVLDEITAGWRLAIGGSHLIFKLEPDLAVFGKAISNGYPMAAIIGKKAVMEMAQESFISSTYWTERIGPAAAIAAIEKMQEQKLPYHLAEIGGQIKKGWETSAAKHGLKISVFGTDPLGHFSFMHDEPLLLKTLFTQLMLERGLLASTVFYASFAHKDRHVKAYLAAVDEIFCLLAKAVRGGNVASHLKGQVCHAGFKRLT